MRMFCTVWFKKSFYFNRFCFYFLFLKPNASHKEIIIQFRASVQLSPRWYLCPLKCPYALSSADQTFPQRWLWNRSNAGLTGSLFSRLFKEDRRALPLFTPRPAPAYVWCDHVLDFVPADRISNYSFSSCFTYLQELSLFVFPAHSPLFILTTLQIQSNANHNTEWDSSLGYNELDFAFMYPRPLNFRKRKKRQNGYTHQKKLGHFGKNRLC